MSKRSRARRARPAVDAGDRLRITRVAHEVAFAELDRAVARMGGPAVAEALSRPTPIGLRMLETDDTLQATAVAIDRRRLAFLEEFATRWQQADIHDREEWLRQLGQPRPEFGDLDGWQRVARSLGLSAERIIGMEFTADEIQFLRNMAAGEHDQRQRGLPIVPESKPAEHSDDFTSVVWYGTTFYFRPGIQADCVRALWGQWKKAPGLGLHQWTILESLDSSTDRDTFRLPLVFRGHPAWGTMIVPTEVRGTYALSTENHR